MDSGFPILPMGQNLVRHGLPGKASRNAAHFKATTLGGDLQTVAQPRTHTRSDVAWL